MFHESGDTMTDQLSRTHVTNDASQAPADLEWTLTDVVQPEVWMGRYRGVYIGMVEHREPDGFSATTHRGRNLGTFATLEDAQVAFYSRQDA